MTTKPAKLDKEPIEAAAEEDVEGHFLNLAAPVAWDIAKARQQEIARDATRHSLIAQAKDKARRKG